MQIVSPDRVDVLQGTAGPMLTLVTCYPFSFVGSAPERLVIHARALSNEQEEATSSALGPVETRERADGSGYQHLSRARALT
jgi:hypothetical protein